MDSMQGVWRNKREASHRCEGCPGCDSPYPLGGIGNPHARVMLIAQEPAYNVDEDKVDIDMSWHKAKSQLEEDRQESMNPLWRHMMNISLALECDPLDLYFTNLVKCAAGDWDERADHCSPYIGGEFAQVDPDLIILHGGKVIEHMFESFDIDWSGAVGDVHGEVFESSSLKFLALYHWGYAYRQGNVSEYNSTVAKAVSEVLS